jgi:hypothetical protein
VTVPDDLAAALQKAKLRTAFDALAYHTPPPATRIDAIGGRRETPGTGITVGSSDVPTGGDPPPPGVGKTMLATALARGAAEAGNRVYFTTAADLAARCHKAAVEGRWSTCSGSSPDRSAS